MCVSVRLRLNTIAIPLLHITFIVVCTEFTLLRVYSTSTSTSSSSFALFRSLESFDNWNNAVVILSFQPRFFPSLLYVCMYVCTYVSVSCCVCRSLFVCVEVARLRSVSWFFIPIFTLLQSIATIDSRSVSFSPFFPIVFLLLLLYL